MIWEAGPGSACLDNSCRRPAHQLGPKAVMMMMANEPCPLPSSQGKLSAAALLVGLGYLDCTQPVVTIALLVLAVSLAGFQYRGFLVNHLNITLLIEIKHQQLQEQLTPSFSTSSSQVRYPRQRYSWVCGTQTVSSMLSPSLFSCWRVPGGLLINYLDSSHWNQTRGTSTLSPPLLSNASCPRQRYTWVCDTQTVSSTLLPSLS